MTRLTLVYPLRATSTHKCGNKSSCSFKGYNTHTVKSSSKSSEYCTYVFYTVRWIWRHRGPLESCLQITYMLVTLCTRTVIINAHYCVVIVHRPWNSSLTSGLKTPRAGRGLTWHLSWLSDSTCHPNLFSHQLIICCQIQRQTAANHHLCRLAAVSLQHPKTCWWGLWPTPPILTTNSFMPSSSTEWKPPPQKSQDFNSYFRDSQCFGYSRGTATGSVWHHVSALTWCLDVKVQLERSPEPPWNHNKQ